MSERLFATGLNFDPAIRDESKAAATKASATGQEYSLFSKAIELGGSGISWGLEKYGENKALEGIQSILGANPYSATAAAENDRLAIGISQQIAGETDPGKLSQLESQLQLLESREANRLTRSAGVISEQKLYIRSVLNNGPLKGRENEVYQMLIDKGRSDLVPPAWGGTTEASRGSEKKSAWQTAYTEIEKEAFQSGRSVSGVIKSKALLAESERLSNQETVTTKTRTQKANIIRPNLDWTFQDSMSMVFKEIDGKLETVVKKEGISGDMSRQELTKILADLELSAGTAADRVYTNLNQAYSDGYGQFRNMSVDERLPLTDFSPENYTRAAISKKIQDYIKIKRDFLVNDIPTTEELKKMKDEEEAARLKSINEAKESQLKDIALERANIELDEAKIDLATKKYTTPLALSSAFEKDNALKAYDTLNFLTDGTMRVFFDNMKKDSNQVGIPIFDPTYTVSRVLDYMGQYETRILDHLITQGVPSDRIAELRGLFSTARNEGESSRKQTLETLFNRTVHLIRQTNLAADLVQNDTGAREYARRLNPILGLKTATDAQGRNIPIDPNDIEDPMVSAIMGSILADKNIPTEIGSERREVQGLTYTIDGNGNLVSVKNGQIEKLPSEVLPQLKQVYTKVKSVPLSPRAVFTAADYSGVFVNNPGFAKTVAKNHPTLVHESQVNAKLTLDRDMIYEDYGRPSQGSGGSLNNVSMKSLYAFEKTQDGVRIVAPPLEEIAKNPTQYHVGLNRINGRDIYLSQEHLDWQRTAKKFGKSPFLSGDVPYYPDGDKLPVDMQLREEAINKYYKTYNNFGEDFAVDLDKLVNSLYERAASNQKMFNDRQKAMFDKTQSEIKAKTPKSLFK